MRTLYIHRMIGAYMYVDWFYILLHARVDQPSRKFRVISNSVWDAHELDRFRGSRCTSLTVERGWNRIVDANTSFTTSTLLPVQPCHKSSWPTSKRVPVARLRVRTYCRQRPTDRGENDPGRRLLLSEVDHPEKPNTIARKSAFSRARGRNTTYTLALRNIRNCNALEIARKANRPSCLSISVAILSYFYFIYTTHLVFYPSYNIKI